jgi:hypothetical protein
MTWARRPAAPDSSHGREAPSDPAWLRFTGSAEYRGLHTYLRDRFADTVVLTFAQIEDLLGGALPDAARLESGWWATDHDQPSAQARTWIQARRTATPHLQAQTVSFERVS